MKIGFYTLGCKLNQAEADELKEKLAAESFSIADNPKSADIVIVSACAVTTRASQRTRQSIRAFKRRGAKIFVIGCLEDKIPEIDFYSKDFGEVVKRIKIISHCRPERSEGSPTNVGHRAYARDSSLPMVSQNDKQSRVRSFLKIQTGCDYNCAFCITRRFRGQSQSIDPEVIIKNIKNKLEHDAEEIVLTGINIGLYHCKKINLPELVQKILKKTKVKRIRFGSLDPRLINNDFLNLFKNERLCPHIHLSTQSGSNRILKAMRRSYAIEDCLKIIKQARRNNPLFSFSADVIVGFPSESKKNFRATCDFVKSAKLVKTHIFPFSARPGTKAAAMINQIPAKIKKERFKALEKIAKASRERYLKQIIGTKRPVLFEGKRRGLWEGYTPEFVRVGIKSSDNLKGKIKDIVIKKTNILSTLQTL